MNNIAGIAFHELESEKYWAFPKNYKKDSKAETKNMIFSGDYIGARKIDGAYYRFIKGLIYYIFFQIFINSILLWL